MMKRMMGLLLAAVMLFALAPAIASASSEEYVENRSGSAVGIYDKPTDETAVKELKDGERVRCLGTETVNGAEWFRTEAGYIKKVGGVECVTVKTAELAVESVSAAYDGNAHKIEAKVVDGDGYRIEYSKDDGKNWSETSPSLKEPGKLTVRVRATKLGGTTLEKTVTLEVKASASSGTSVKIVNCRTAVNIRKGPGSNTAKIGTAKKGRVFKLLGVEADGKWYKIQYTSSTVGYVFHDYAKVCSDTPDPDPEPTGKTGTIVNCKTQVNVREKASSKSKLLGTARKGEQFDVLGTSGSWVRIDYKGKTGYVYKTYIKVTGEDPVTPITGKKGTIVNCKTQVNVRAKASSNAALLGVAKKGETYDVLGKSGNWYKIDFDGEDGFVFHTYLRLDGESGKTVTVVNCKSWVNVREKASSKSKILGTAEKGDTYDLLGKSGNWYKIDYKGRTAYIFHSYIKVN